MNFVKHVRRARDTIEHRYPFSLYGKQSRTFFVRAMLVGKLSKTSHSVFTRFPLVNSCAYRGPFVHRRIPALSLAPFSYVPTFSLVSLSLLR